MLLGTVKEDRAHMFAIGLEQKFARDLDLMYRSDQEVLDRIRNFTDQRID